MSESPSFFLPKRRRPGFLIGALGGASVSSLMCNSLGLIGALNAGTFVGVEYAKWNSLAILAWKASTVLEFSLVFL